MGLGHQQVTLHMYHSSVTMSTRVLLLCEDSLPSAKTATRPQPALVMLVLGLFQRAKLPEATLLEAAIVPTDTAPALTA
jgi:hypothetical protein